MNERIRLLAEQAGITTNIDTNYFEKDMNKWVDYFSEKFAELIVRECIDKIETYRIPVGNSAAGEMACEWTYDALKEIRNEIKEHFGVEEQEKVAPKPKCSVCGTTENVRYMGGYQPYLCDSVDCIPF